ncbi:1893_t:CDS:10 [Ambispora gerdemannii]|uniref:1893_t:CDS:1 n=1 Tax=Ambispora gerdemannii TaxID=144530 RepID=A0A9N9FQF9_9GLOM|nr:1893_t:CDS:10 [Ambispora gerdemannii]
MGIRRPSDEHVYPHVNGSVSPSGPSPSTSPTYQMPNGHFSINERERRSRSSSDSSVYSAERPTSSPKSRPLPPQISTNVGTNGTQNSSLTRKFHVIHKSERKMKERQHRVSFADKDNSPQVGSPPNEYAYSPSPTTPIRSGTPSPTQTPSSDLSQRTLTPNSPKTSSIVPPLRVSSLNYQFQSPSSSNSNNSNNSSVASNQMQQQQSNKSEDNLSSPRPSSRKESPQKPQKVDRADSYPSVTKLFYDVARNLQATLNHTNFCVIDVTGIDDPAKIKNKIFDALEIKDDREIYNIHLTEIGQKEDGPIINDEELVKKCKNADRIGTLKLFVKKMHASEDVHYYTAIERNPTITHPPFTTTSIEVKPLIEFVGGFRPNLVPEIQQKNGQQRAHLYTDEPSAISISMPQPVIYQQQPQIQGHSNKSTPFSLQLYNPCENIDRQQSTRPAVKFSSNKLQHPPNLTPGAPPKINNIIKNIVQQSSPLSSIASHPYPSSGIKRCLSEEQIGQKKYSNFARIQNEMPIKKYNSVENFDQPPKKTSHVPKSSSKNILGNFNNFEELQREHTINANLTETCFVHLTDNSTTVKPTEEEEPPLWAIIDPSTIEEEDKIGKIWIDKPISNPKQKPTEEEEPPLWAIIDPSTIKEEDKIGKIWVDKPISNPRQKPTEEEEPPLWPIIDPSTIEEQDKIGKIWIDKPISNPRQKPTEEEEPPLWPIIDPSTIPDGEKKSTLWINKPISISSTSSSIDTTLVNYPISDNTLTNSDEDEDLLNTPPKSSREETPKDPSKVRFDVPSSSRPERSIARSVSMRRGLKDSWVVRPTVEDVYEDLQEYFPEHDLDKEIDGTDSGIIHHTNNDGETMPSMTTSTNSTGKKKLARGRSIRHVAEQIVNRERQQWAIATTAVQANTKLKRKITKIWGTRTEQVKPGQSWTSQQGQSIDDNNNKTPEEKTVPKIKWARGALIGKGTFGKVYIAFNLSTQEMIAVKQVERPTTASDMLSERQNSLVRSFYAEMNLLKVLDHDHIVQYLGYEETPEALNIFLEYVNGGSIGTCLKINGKFQEPVVRSFTRQILLGLEYLHEKSILHRDIKSDNILVNEDGCCKISDFGISKKINHAYAYDNQSNMSLQGTIFYLAPEVFTEGYSAKVDIWSLGCVVIEMFTGNRPWATFNDLTAMYKIGKEKKHPPIPNESMISPEAKDFLERCFIIDPTKRPRAEELSEHPFVREDPNFQFKKYIKVPPIVPSK